MSDGAKMSTADERGDQRAAVEDKKQVATSWFAIIALEKVAGEILKSEGILRLYH